MASSHIPRGQSVVEILVAIALLGLLTTASFVLISSSSSEGLASADRARAQGLLWDGFEAARQIRNADFQSLVAGTHGIIKSNGTWSFTGTEDVTDQTFHRTVAITSVNSTEAEITVSVSWTAQNGRSVSVTESSRLTAWQTPTVPTATSCYGASVTGDWTNPVVIGTADIGAGSEGTDLVVSLPYAFEGGIASSSAKKDLFVFDVSTPASPTLATSVDIGSGGLNSLSKSGNYLYAASPNDAKELIIFDVTNPAAASELAHTDMAGNADAQVVLAKGNFVAVGRALSDKAEIYAYDVTAPGTPSLVATFETTGSVNDLAANATTLFAVTSGTGEELVMYDITDPIHPALIRTFDLQTDSAAQSVSYQDPGVLYIGTANGQLLSVDVADPSNPSVTSTNAMTGTIKDMACISTKLLFAGTDNSNKEFQIFDISDLSAITLYASINFPQVVTGIDFASNMVFASVRSNDALRIITSSP